MSEMEFVRQVLARYVRATDRRNGDDMAALFAPDGIVEINWHNSGKPVSLGQLQGPEQIAWAVREMMKPHPERGWSHHTTFDHIIEIDGDSAEMDAQFIVYNTVGAAKPENGWPKDAFGAQGVVTPIEAGYYHSTLRKVDGRWLIAKHRIDLDLPVAASE